MSSGTGLRGHSVEGHCLQPATTIGMEELVDGAQDDLSHHRRVHRLDRGRTSGTDGHLVALLDILQLAGSRDDLDAWEGDLHDKLPELRQVYAVSYTHLRAHETGRNLVCRLLLEKKKK